MCSTLWKRCIWLVIKVTASIGVKRFDINNRTLEENIALADKSLYKAKTLGKNKVVY